MSEVEERILFHIPALGAGGAERQLAILVKGLANKGFEPHVVALYPGGTYWEELASHRGVRVVSLDRRGRWDFSVIKKLANYAKTHRIGMIQGWMPPANTFAAIAGRLARLPVVFGVRASDARWPTIGGKVYLRTDAVLSKLIAKRVVCNSEGGMCYHIGIGYPRSKLLLIPNGLEFPEDSPTPMPFAHDPPWRLGMLARLDPMKDHPTMLRAMGILLQQNMDVELHIYGDGLAQYQAELMRLSQELKVSDRVYWHGHVPDTWMALSQLDILVSSSFNGEGMSNAIMEGMAAERVVVATDVGDSKLLLTGFGAECGYVVAPRSPEALATAILDILQRPEIALARATCAHKIARQHFGAQAMVEAYVDLYRSVLSEEPS